MIGCRDDEFEGNLFVDSDLGSQGLSRETVKQEFTELYREMTLLKNFGVLNYTGIDRNPHCNPSRNVFISQTSVKHNVHTHPISALGSRD